MVTLSSSLPRKAPALGVRAKIVELFEGGPVATGTIEKSFASFDVGAPPGMAPHVSGPARSVLETTLSTGETATFWVAPTAAGGFCTLLELRRPTGENLGAGGGCDRDRLGRLSPDLSIPGPFRGDVIERGPVVLSGDTLIRDAAKVEIRFQDGEVASAPLTWVSAPIDAGFFVYSVPADHWTSGHRPDRIVVRGAGGDELAGVDFPGKWLPSVGPSASRR